MTGSYDAFCPAGTVFFDRPVPPAGFAPLELPGWTVRLVDGWLSACPAGAELPEQGWKIHVSSTGADAQSTLTIVAGYCARHRIAFKHLPSPAALLRRSGGTTPGRRAANGKNADRGGSGKSSPSTHLTRAR